MKRALLFPGQASQYVGMASDLVERYPKAQKLFAMADEIMGFKLSDICFNGPIEKLTETDITQPAVFTHSIAMLELLKERNYTFHVTAGHSLGEFSALVAGGVLRFEDALEIVKKRGQLMKACNVQNPGTMAAILKFDISIIRDVCESIDDIVQVANFNSDAQIVISGTKEGVQKAMQMIKERGAKIVKELQVGGAFHSPLMKPAEEELAKIIHATAYKDAHCDVYTNVSAKAERSGAVLKELSIKQLTSSVLWFDIMLNMIQTSVNEFAECGPSNVLSGIAKRIDGVQSCKNFDKASDLEQIEGTV